MKIHALQSVIHMCLIETKTKKLKKQTISKCLHNILKNSYPGGDYTVTSKQDF